MTEVTAAVYFCCTGLGVASTGRYPASCPVKPGLSSSAIMHPRSPVRLIIFVTGVILSINYTGKQLPPTNSLTMELLGRFSELTPRK